MLQAVRDSFRLPDLRKRILFTLFIVAVYRLGSFIPVPGVDVQKVQDLFKEVAQAGSIFGLLDVFAGGALSQFAIFALGIMPYITASIIMSLLQVVVPKLEQWSKEGEAGQRKTTYWTRYLTLVLAFVQSIGLTVLFQSQLRLKFALFDRFLIVLTLVAGTVLIMWLGELVTQKGIGNGMSLLITVSILSRFPEALAQTIQTSNPFIGLAVIVMILVIIAAIIVLDTGQRRIPVQYAKRVVGRKIYGGQSTYIPIKINSAGVIPIIFASSVLLFPATLAQFFPGDFFKTLSQMFSTESVLYLSVFGIFIVFFTYFYTSIVFNPVDIADNIKKYGGFIPGVRPGGPTAAYLDRVISRLTLPGALFLAVIALLPSALFSTLNVPFFKFFGGISLLIIVGVSLETMRQLETQLLMRHYEGFLK
uniref:Protein translocase subunit SecY n=1 Tax=uncultured actinobacterium Rifle_16ft_4_minimus_550 TaxID=1665149 RepID=A0A0H4T987_9ACTN|nr:preprotein translocase subunit SecY, preprotein translocase subunit SecY [uncultured actinobacterium Rifle_16ft_4_minimus_550]